MSSKAETFHTKTESKLSERGPFPPGHWWLAVHTEGEWFPGAGTNSFFGLTLRDDVTQDEAQQFERMFDRMVTGMSFTRFVR